MIIFTAGAKNEEHKSVPVYTHFVELRNIFSSILCKGTIRENRVDTVLLADHAKVVEVYVKTGDMVNKGDPLLTVSKINHVDLEQYQGVFGDMIGKSIEEYASKSLAGTLESGGLLDVEKRNVEYRIFEANTTIYAHMDGIIKDVSANENALLLKNTPCLTISDVSQIFVFANIPERHMVSARVNQSALVTGEAFKTSYTGRVSKIMPVATKTGSFLTGEETVVECVIKLDDPGPDLRPGYSASVKIVTEIRRSAAVVPYEAIMQDPNNNEYVFVLYDGRLYKQYIRTGLEMEDVTEVTHGLNASQVVVINPDDSLRAGLYAYSVD